MYHTVESLSNMPLLYEVSKPKPSGPEESWWDALQKSMMKASFMYTDAKRCRKEAEDRLMAMTTEDEKMRYMARLIGMDQRIMAHMLEATTRWKEDTVCDLYMLVYHEAGTTRRSKMMILSYLLGHERVEPWMGRDLMTWMVDDTDWEAYDVLTRFQFILNEAQIQRMHEWANNHRWADQQLHRIHDNHPLGALAVAMRGIERFPTHFPVIPRVVYEDQQNVHDVSINNSVWKNIEVLLNERRSTCDYDDFDIIRNRLGFLSPAQEKALLRLYTDRSLFSRRSSNRKITVTLWIVFLMVWAYAMEASCSQIEEILGRIREELAEMSGTCATGHLSRLVNVLIGFHPKIEVRISDKDRLRGIFQVVLQATITEEENADDILCDMINPKKNGVFHQFFLRCRSTMMDEVLKRASINDVQEKDVAIQDLQNMYETMYPSLFPLHQDHDIHTPVKDTFSDRLNRMGQFLLGFPRFLREVLRGPF